MTGRRIKVLHLAFEDHLRPGSGGGGRRSYEVNRRLAADHDITVVTARYPGCRPRIEDGLRYRQIGFSDRHYLSIISYHLMIPWVVLRARADLVVEDFASPISSALVPLFTRSPTLAIVQWLFAAETSRQYHLPFFVLENLGVRLHRRFVAVSHYIAAELRRRNPRARVDVVYPGLPDAPPPEVELRRTSCQVLFLGRLQVQAKGLDLLLEAFGMVARSTGARLVIAGDGPDRAHLAHLVSAAGLSERVELRAWAGPEEKWRLLRESALVVIPSRYESFGLVAIEAMAAGTPVAAFGIPAMRELLGPLDGVTEPFDSQALAARILRLLGDRALRERIGAQGRLRAAQYNWDEAARLQDAAYRAAVDASVRGRARWWR